MLPPREIPAITFSSVLQLFRNNRVSDDVHDQIWKGINEICLVNLNVKMSRFKMKFIEF